MGDEVFQKYAKETGIDRQAIKLVNEKLKLPKERLSSFARPRRLEAVKEAIGWEKGPDQERHVITELYKINEYIVAIGKPGKEAAPDYKRHNPNDMNPQILKGGKKITKDLSFWEMFEMIENLKHTNAFGLELLGMLLFRAAFMLDHKKNKMGKWRYCPPEEIIKILEDSIPTISEIPIRVFLHFIEVISLNEDVKIHNRGTNPEFKQDYGRTNTLLTFVHLIAVLLERRSIAKLAGSFSRLPAGMSPIPKTKVILECFPLLNPNLFGQ